MNPFAVPWKHNIGGFLNDFFFHHSWFTVSCQFSTVQQGDPVTHTYIYIRSFFSQYHAPS